MNFKKNIYFMKRRNETVFLSLLLFLCITMSFFLLSCDSAFKYIFIPSARIQYTLVPDSSLTAYLKDSSYYISKDGMSAVFDKKDYKVEIKYLSDYQLNNFEFPEESKSGEYSTNPYTYANWVNPQLGFTPNRFTIFKVTVYNYAAPKINYDPENTILYSSRGDNLFAYGKDEKTSRYQSLEAYFKKNSGAGGLQDEIFEGRMGIVRNTLFTLGKPLFRGDNRQGILVFDPLSEDVEKIKLKIDKFILGYDENNEANEFTDVIAYFKRIPFVLPKDQLASGISQKDSSTTFVLPDFDINKLAQEANVVQLKYPATNVTVVSQEYWNPAPEAMKEMTKYINNNTSLKTVCTVSDIESNDFRKSKIAFMIGESCSPSLTDTVISSLTEYIKNGGFLFIDNADAQIASSFGQTMDKVLFTIAGKLGTYARYQRIPASNPIFSTYKKFKSVPPGQEAYAIEGSREQIAEYIEGIYYKGKIVAVLSHKGYSKAWGLWKSGGRNLDNDQQLAFGTNMVIYAVVSNLKNKK
jgi:hypothetical protein